MKLEILCPRGLHASELRAINMMKEHLRDSWHGYASFLVGDDQGNFELDLLLFTHDRILLVEVKEWAGIIDSDGKNWYQKTKKGTRKDQSPVSKKRNHADRLASLFKSELQDLWGGFYMIETCVVLAGTAEIGQMPDNERRFVYKLEEFLKIRSAEDYERLLPERNTSVFDRNYVKRPNNGNQIAIFEKWLRGGDRIKPRVREESGYLLLDEEATFHHPKRYYAEYVGEHTRDASDKALMRAWDFNQLGALAQTQEQRAFLGLREDRAIRYIKLQDHQLAKDYLLQPKHSLNEEDVGEDLVEVYERPALLERLDSHLQTLEHTVEARGELLRALLTPFAAMHSMGVSHRDITHHRLWWDRSSQALIISGLIASKFPDQRGQSVGDLRTSLATNSVVMPEDAFGEVEIDNPRIDVYQLGVLAYHIAFNKPLKLLEDTPAEWYPPEADPFEGKLDEWFQQALDYEASSRQADANVMLEQLTKLLFFKKHESDDDKAAVQSALNEHLRFDKNPMVDYQPSGNIEQDHVRQRMMFNTNIDDQCLTVRLFFNAKPDPDNPGRSRRLLQFIKRCESISSNALAVPHLVEFGFSMMGLYTVQHFVEGITLSEWLENEAISVEQRYAVAESLLRAVHQLHDLDLNHGDLKPENILVVDDGDLKSIQLLDMLDIDLEGLTPTSSEYAPKIDVSNTARDRYAVYVLMDEIFGGCGGGAKQVRDEIRTALGDDLQQVPLSLEPLRHTLTLSQEPEPEAQEELIIEWPNLPNDAGQLLPQDQGQYYLSVSTNNGVRVYITGTKQKLILIFDGESENLTLGHVRLNSIGTADWLKDSQQATNPKRPLAQVITKPILLKRGNATEQQSLIDFLKELPAFREALQVEDKKEPVNHTPTNGNPPIKLLWEKLVEVEREMLPKVTTVSRPKKVGGQWHLSIQEDIASFEFSIDSTINVISELQHARFGTLDISKCDDGLLVFDAGYRMDSLKGGTELLLFESGAESSWDRRRQALDRVLAGEALMPDLIEKFIDGPKGRQAPELPSPTEEQIAKYGLDESKAEAFRYALKNSLGCVMGPPGTGKTTLLGALLHYLMTETKIQRILLVSQSHVAANEVAIRARDLIRKLALESELDPNVVEPTMVRLGEFDKIGKELVDIHTTSLQAQTRTAFYRDLDSRMLSLAQRLKLPEELVLDSATLYRSFGRELYSYDKCRNDLSDLHKQIGEDNLSEKDIIRIERAQREVTRYKDALESGLLAYTEFPQEILDSKNPLQELVAILAERHQINNPQRIQRLVKLINIVHHWYQRLSADTDGYASFAARTQQLVVGTLVGIGKNSYKLHENAFDLVLIDEAGRATFSELAIAMQCAKRVLLVGDHKQLAPQYDKAHIRSVCRELSISESDAMRTDFERAFNMNNGQMLSTQYRMAPPIGELVSHCFYNGKLETGRKDAADWLENMPTPWNKTVTWLDTSGSSTLESNVGNHGIANTEEVELLCSLLRQLSMNTESVRRLRKWANDDGLPSIGVITGYRKQVDLLKQRIDSESWAAPIRSLIKVDTIDAYQGSENRIVLISLVRHNTNKKSGFLNESSRINVALSRAKERLIIVGAGSMWSNENAEAPLSKVYNYMKNKSALTDSAYQILQPNDFAQTSLMPEEDKNYA